MMKASTAIQNTLHITAKALKWAKEPSNPSNCKAALIAKRTILTMRAFFELP